MVLKTSITDLHTQRPYIKIRQTSAHPMLAPISSWGVCLMGPPPHRTMARRTNIAKAKKKPLDEVNAAALGLATDLIGLKGSPTTVRRVFAPEKKKGGIKIEGTDPRQAAKKLVEFLAEKGVI